MILKKENNVIWESYTTKIQSDEFKSWTEFPVFDKDQIHPEAKELISRYRAAGLPYQYDVMYCVYTKDAQYGCKATLDEAQRHANKINGFVVRADRINDMIIKKSIIKQK